MKRSKASPPEPLSDSPDDLVLAKLQKVQKKRGVYRFIVPLVVVAVCVVVVFGFLLQISPVSGSSMLPTFYQGEWVLLWRLDRTYARNDVIAFVPEDPESAAVADKELIKRVIGLPGETVDIQNGAVLINGTPLNEPEIDQETVQKPAGPGVPVFPLTLGPNEYFVLGDNRGNSMDSRNFGVITRSEIAGRIIVSLRFLSRAHSTG
ncbi:MAG: signal peptidase I [Firmicutes bacterium]|nr:signal peptidase I [Bacillota bacterium]